ncbi:putative baseplate assembly protein [Cohnella sp. GCM10012308]|uniref:putative baseplate assembly protein n=1 Tax=Cohnella sp. GCM10012308 TaxID=3317329 RepID=UPI0036187C34
MLPKLPLDDRTYESILLEARQGIQRRLPEWTDENAHDPGMTMLELFAWISEMQQFYLSRVPDRNRRKFLELLGESPRQATSAAALASFDDIRETVVLPQGTKLLAEDQTFETASSTTLRPLAVDRIVTRTEREASDRTASNTQGDVAFYAFGADARAGSRLYVSFDREPPVGEPIELTILLAEEGNHGSPDARHAMPLTAALAALPADTSEAYAPPVIVPSARIAWKGYAYDEQTGASGWLPVETACDETLHLSFSGRVTIKLTAPLRPVLVHPANDRPRWWICCVLEEEGYEEPPRIDRILLHTALVVQRDTLSETIDYDVPEEGEVALSAATYLSRYGLLRVQVREPDGRWREWREVPDAGEAGPDDRVYAVRLPQEGGTQIVFGNGEHGMRPPVGPGSVRRIHADKTFSDKRFIGRSNGLPMQRFTVYDLACRRREHFLLQVGLPGERAGEWIWEDWLPVENFDRSGPLDRHYTFDPDTCEIRFGNDERGAIPPACEESNLCLVVCVLGGGERGNIKPSLLTGWVSEEQRAYGVTVNNAGYGYGGAESESVGDCIERLQRRWHEPYRAVTDEDYAALAKSTPGLRVARVHVIAGYAPGRSDPVPHAVTVVAMPFSRQTTPKPSRGFLQTVARHLDERRLIGTEVHVIAPEYIKVTVHAVIVVEPQFAHETKRIAAVLNELLSPSGSLKSATGWPFGRPVYRGDVFAALSRIGGVAYVQELWLDGEGRYAAKSQGGDVLLPPNGLVYSGEHRIELLSRTQL